MFWKQDRAFLRKLRQTQQWTVEEIRRYDGLTVQYKARHKKGTYFYYNGPERLIDLPFCYYNYSNHEQINFELPYMIIAFFIKKHLKTIHTLYLLSG